MAQHPPLAAPLPTGAPQTAFKPAQIAQTPAVPTVESRVAGIISRGGLLQQASATQAKQFQQERGLLSSSMTAGAIQKANIEAALPIAQQDVGFLQQAGLEQVRGREQRLSITAQAEAESGLMVQREDIDKRMLTASADEQLRLIVQRGQIDTALQKLKGIQTIEEIRTTGDIQKELQTAEGSARIELLQEQGRIDAGHLTLRQTNLKEITTIQADLESRLQSERAEISKQLIGAEADAKTDLLRQQGLIDLKMATENGVIASRLQNELFEINAKLTEMKAGYQTENLELQLESERLLTEMKGDIQTQLQTLVGSQALEMQGLDAAHTLDLKRLEGDYNVLINTQRSAAVVFAEVSTSISEILANPDIPMASKQGLIDHQYTLLKTSLAVMGGISDMNLLGLLNFGGETGSADTGNTGEVNVTDKTGYFDTATEGRDAEGYYTWHWHKNGAKYKHYQRHT